MPSRKDLDLLVLLSERTLIGRLSWARTERGSFQTIVSGYGIELSRSIADEYAEDEPVYDYFVIFYNEHGEPVETMIDTEFREFSEEVNVYLLLKDLYDQAHRSAVGTDRILNEIYTALASEVSTDSGEVDR